MRPSLHASFQQVRLHEGEYCTADYVHHMTPCKHRTLLTAGSPFNLTACTDVRQTSGTQYFPRRYAPPLQAITVRTSTPSHTTSPSSHLHTAATFKMMFTTVPMWRQTMACHILHKSVATVEKDNKLAHQLQSTASRSLLQNATLLKVQH
jgi:hypothetical protein